MFKFSLQRVLELKERREQAAATALAVQRAAADRARQECETLEATREEGVRQRISAGPPTIGELRTVGFLLERLDERIQMAQGVVKQEEARVQASLNQFKTASQERRVLDRLRERKLGDWQTEQVQEDRKTMDGIALNRFTQKSATTDEEEA